MRSKIAQWFVTIIIAAAVGYAAATFVTSRNAVSSNTPLAAPTVNPTTRQTVTLAEHTVQTIVAGDGIVVSTDDGAFALQAAITPADQAYGLLNDPVAVKAMIDGGPVGFDCPWQGLTNTPTGLRMECRIPKNITVVDGLTGSMVLQMDKPQKVMALPTTAVNGTEQTGQVVVMHDDGSLEARQVAIGVSDESWVEITDGLRPGERVLLVPTEADFAGRS